MRWIILFLLLLMGLYATLCISKSGERLEVITGKVQSCDTLGGGKIEGISHATIKTNSGHYIISPLRNCSPRMKVEVYLNRGALYFNTVYATE